MSERTHTREGEEGRVRGEREGEERGRERGNREGEEREGGEGGRVERGRERWRERALDLHDACIAEDTPVV